jgi:OOP family OmpA-OmpF porin
VAGGVVALATAFASRARADEPQLHGELGLAHALGNPQQREYGFGAGANVAGELTFGKIFGVQAEVSFLGLADGSPPSNPAFANHGAGFDFGAMGGVRLHPFARSRVAGLWLDGNVGIAVTGGAARASFDSHVGYDFRVGHGRLDLGPFLGYTQVFQPDDTLRPEDAHVALVGLHVALGAPLPTVLVRTDRDADGVFDDEDACPDEAGIRTNDPKTNGCPRGDRDHDFVFDDEDACPDIQGVRTNDPKTNGCPRSDRDNDTVFDDEDACPDIPGIRTTDPKTNGCPAAGDQVRLEGDKLVLDEIIHFDTDSPRIRHASWALCKKVADFIQANPDVLEIDIEGHADETGTSAHNLVLSRDRANAVKTLIVKYGVDAKRITTHAYGETRPKVPGHAEEQLKQNRRVEFTVTRSRARATELKPVAPPSTPTTPVAPTPPTETP